MDYLRYPGKDTGNKLEQDVLCKLQDPVELCHLNVYSLMYYHIYGDLLRHPSLKSMFISFFNE